MMADVPGQNFVFELHERRDRKRTVMSCGVTSDDPYPEEELNDCNSDGYRHKQDHGVGQPSQRHGKSEGRQGKIAGNRAVTPNEQTLAAVLRSAVSICPKRAPTSRSN